MKQTKETKETKETEETKERIYRYYIWDSGPAKNDFVYYRRTNQTKYEIYREGYWQEADHIVIPWVIKEITEQECLNALFAEAL